MTTRKVACDATRLILFAAVTLASPHAALAQSSAAPKTLRVAGVTDWTVTLTREPAKGKAPSSYVIQCSNGRSMTVPRRHRC